MVLHCSHSLHASFLAITTRECTAQVQWNQTISESKQECIVHVYIHTVSLITVINL